MKKISLTFPKFFLVLVLLGFLLSGTWLVVSNPHHPETYFLLLLVALAWGMFYFLATSLWHKSYIRRGVAWLLLAGLLWGGWKAMTIFQQLQYAIFPHTRMQFETSMEPVDFYLGAVHYRVPKAYLYWPPDMEGGKQKQFSMRANIEEDMVPWTRSQNYKNRVEKGGVYITMNDQNWDTTTLDFPNYRIKNILESQKRSFEARYNEVTYGTYKEIFTRYNELDQITNTNPEGIGSNFYLIPKIKSKNPFFIKCTSSANRNPDHLCRVEGFMAKNIHYNFTIPFGIVEEFAVWDQKVQQLLTQLIVQDEIKGKE